MIPPKCRAYSEVPHPPAFAVMGRAPPARMVRREGVRGARTQGHPTAGGGSAQRETVRMPVAHRREALSGLRAPLRHRLFTGMRKAEFGRLAKADITPQGITLPAASTKTGQRRFIEMPPPLAAWLKAYPVGDPVLRSAWGKKEKAVRRLARWKVWSDLVKPQVPPDDLPDWPHNALRHTHASALVAQGKPLEKLIFEFGHSGGMRMLKSHYVGVMAKSEALKIMKIRPRTGI